MPGQDAVIVGRSVSCSCYAASVRLRIASLGLVRRKENWRQPRVGPLLARQRELLDQLDGNTDGEKEKAAREQLERVAFELHELDFSTDSFWVELELLAERERGSDQAAAESISRARDCWQSLILGGQPFQLLHSRPLQMAGSFLRGVLAAIGAPTAEPQGLYVISVIGAQSSAKSTLLNFLFGCGFAVSAGRCTRGLHGAVNHVQPTSKVRIRGRITPEACFEYRKDVEKVTSYCLVWIVFVFCG